MIAAFNLDASAYEFAFLVVPVLGIIALFYLASISGHLAQLRAEIQELKDKTKDD